MDLLLKEAHIEHISKLLEDILKNRRHDLPIFLMTYGSYDILRKCLVEIENRSDNKNIIRDLLLGRIGAEWNKQMSFFELPTYELLEVINKLCNMYNLSKIDIVNSSIGLLANMLECLYKKDINVISNGLSLETSVKMAEITMSDKQLSEYTSAEDDKLYIFPWAKRNNMTFTNIAKFLMNIKPKYACVIDDYPRQANMYNKIFEKFKLDGYRVVSYPVKQLCFKNYFKYNKIEGLHSRSHITFLVKDDTHPLDEIEFRTMCGEQNFHEKIVEECGDVVIQDLCVGKHLPDFLLEIKDDIDIFQKSMILCHDAHASGIDIPEWIYDYNILKFWLEKTRAKIFPLDINNKEKCLEYYDLYTDIHVPGNFEKYKKKGYFPDWVVDGEKDVYIFVDYSTKNKTWKLSRSTFRRSYQNIFRSIGGNSSNVGTGLMSSFFGM
jgi:hypothetical protein